MAETTTLTMNVGLTYTDYSTRTYKLPIREMPTELEPFKTAIRNFNVAASSASSSVAQTFISDNGAPVASINEATLVIRTEEVLYSVE